MSSDSYSYSQKNNSLKHKMYTAIRADKLVVAHVAKSKAICVRINDFYSSLQRIAPNKMPVSKEDDAKYNKLIVVISNLQKLYESLSEKEYLRTITSNPIDFVNDQLTSFTAQFNELAISLNLASAPPIEVKREQFIIDDKNDCVELKEKLMPLSTTPNVQQTILLLTKQIEVLESQSKLLINSAKQNADVLTHEQVVDELMEFKQYFIDPDDYELKRMMWNTSVASVYQGICKSTGQIVSIKKMTKSTFTKESFDAFKREISIMIHTTHFAFAPFIGFTCSDPFYIVTNFMNGETLFQRIHASKKVLTGTKMTIIALGIAYGMSYLHSEHIIYRNLKSLNILLDIDDYPHICDLETCRVCSGGDERLTPKVGAAPWMAPEILNEQTNYSFSADVYSYGVILYELVTKEIPWKGLTEVQIAVNVLRKKEKLQIPSETPLKIKQLIEKCLNYDPEKRPTFATIVSQLESGEAVFPYTAPDSVEAYKNTFASSLDIQLNNFDYKNYNKAKFSAIFVKIIEEEKNAEDLSKEDRIAKQEKIITFLSNVVNTEGWLAILDVEKMMAQVSDILGYFVICNNTSKLLDILYILVKSPAYQKELSRKNYSISKKCLRVFDNSDEQLESFIYIMNISLKCEDDKPKISHNQLFRIGTYMGSVNIDLTREAFNLVELIFTLKIYDNLQSFSLIIPTIFTRLLPYASHELINQVMPFLLLLCNEKVVLTQINKMDGSMLILDFCLQTSTAERAMSILVKLCTNAQSTPAFATKFIHQFSKIITIFHDDEMIYPLTILETLLQLPTTFKNISDRPSAIQSLGKALSKGNTNTKISCLKIIFALLENEISVRNTVVIVDDIKDQMLSDDENITAIAASCIVLVIGYLLQTSNEAKKIFYDEFFGDYINKAIHQSLNSQLAAARLSGVLAQTFLGCKMLETMGCITEICDAFIKTKDRNLKFYLLASLASVTSFISYIDDMECVIPHVFELTNEDRAYTVVPMFIANVCVSPKGAFAVAPYYSKIIDKIVNYKSQENASSDQQSSQQDKNSNNIVVSNPQAISLYLAAIQRISSEPDACDSLSKEDVSLTTNLLQLCSRGYLHHVLSIIINLIENEDNIEILKCKGMSDTILTYLPVVHSSNQIHYILNRLKIVFL